MKIYVLGSGSKGNSTLIVTKNTNILIDIGFSYTLLKQKLESIHYKPSDINHILITHDHTDHIFGLMTFLKRNKPFVYLSEEIEEKIFENYEYSKIINLNNKFNIDNINIQTIPTSHDSTTSCGFIVEEDNESLVYITDTGYIHRKNFKLIENKTYYVIESNHDPEILRKGPYPIYLQNRILSDKGHLSNEVCAGYLSRLIGPNTKKVILAHLSETNNNETVALNTVNSILKENEIKFNDVECASQDKILEVSK